MAYKKLTDKLWAIIQPHLSTHKRYGRCRAEDRATIDAIIFVLVTGCRWADLPKEHGSKSTAHKNSKICKKEEFGKRFSSVQSDQHTNKIK